MKNAYVAAWALDSFASHIFLSHKNCGKTSAISDRNYRRDFLCSKSEAFHIIADLSAALKYAELSKPKDPKKSRLVSKSSEVNIGLLEGWSAYFGRADDWGKQAILQNETRIFRALLPIVLDAEKFLLATADFP